MSPKRLQRIRLGVAVDLGRNARNELKTTLELEYLPEVNVRVRKRFHDALAHTEDPVEYHRYFRLMAALLAHPHDVIAQFANAPTRTI
jgi:hypothetical protein